MFLGIDIGTTKTAAVIINRDKSVLVSCSIEHKADISSEKGRSEQNVSVLLQSMQHCTNELPKEFMLQVNGVGLTGQMHGISMVDADGNPVSPLITWKDQRCLESYAFLKKLNQSTGHILHTGDGCASLAWLAQHNAVPSVAAGCGTIMDIAAALLCGMKKPVIDPTNAASWGLFDLETYQWEKDVVLKAGFDPALLPDIVQCGIGIGSVCPDASAETGIPESVPVYAAIGDNQASLLSTLADPVSELAITIGTGAQISAIIDKKDIMPLPPDASYNYRPFPGGRMAIVAAPLCGGSAWAWLVDSIESWYTETGATPPPRAVLFGKLDELGLTAEDSLSLKPHFLGERHNQCLKGEISGITLSNFSLGQVSRALAHGIIENLHSMLPVLAFAGRKQIVGSGNALRKTKLLQKKTEEIFKLPLKMNDGREEAATGAAILAMHL
jgi:sedoheptulokinase